MNKFVNMWKRIFDKLVGGGFSSEEQVKTTVPRHIKLARRAANQRARASRRVNRLLAKGKHL